MGIKTAEVTLLLSSALSHAVPEEERRACDQIGGLPRLFSFFFLVFFFFFSVVFMVIIIIVFL